MSERTQAIQGLRELADFLDTHPSVPFTSHHMYEFVETREEWEAIEHKLRQTDTTSSRSDDFLVIHKMCAGGVSLEVTTELEPSDKEEEAR